MGVFEQLKEWVMKEKHSNPAESANERSDPALGNPLKDSNHHRLAQAIDEAGLLIWYICKKGIGDIDTKGAEIIATTKEKFYANSLSSAEESLFWDNYRILAKAILPVSIDSIIASYGLDAESKATSRKTIRIYSSWTLITLFGLIVFQMYWFVGTSVTADIEQLISDVQQARQKSMEVERERTAIEFEEFTNKRKIEKREEELAGGKFTDERKAEHIEADIADLKNERLKILSDKSAIRRKMAVRGVVEKEKNDILTEHFQLLDRWDFYSEWLLASALAELDEVKDKLKMEGLDEDTENELKGRLWEMEKEKERISWRATKLVLAIFNQYVLPLLYGLLGSLAYILRTLTAEIQEVTYTQGSNVRYRLRWPLGMLAGVTIGWFFNPETLQGAAAITPLALAFLAGYSVELLFTGLDRIVGAFTGQHGQAKGQTGG
jgi:hypothetical protein